MSSITQSSIDNGVLARLSAEDFSILGPALEWVDLKLAEILHQANEVVEFAYFPTAGICSVIAENASGVRIETGIIGKEGFIGIPIVLFAGSTPSQILVQAEGRALRIAKEDLRQVMAKSPFLMALLLRYVHVFGVQTSQAAVANGHYSINERLARWLLMSQDRVDSPGFTMTHEFLSVMLAVRRASVTEAVNELEAQGLIRATRGRISIIDRSRLEKVAADSYGVPEKEYKRLILEGGIF
jgi:CRP-like cAMP-binding protein